MVKVILVRHGETTWNRRELFRGRANVALNRRGKEQARALAEALKDVAIDAIYSSPLSRAVETAEAIAGSHRIAVQLEQGFIDIDYGAWQGVSRDEVQQRYARVYEDWMERPHTVTFEGGESLRMVRRRAMSALRRIVRRHEGETVVITAHRVVNKVVLCAVLGLNNTSFWSIRQDTCAINIFERSNGVWIMRSLNDTCHLKHIGGKELADF